MLTASPFAASTVCVLYACPPHPPSPCPPCSTLFPTQWLPASRPRLPCALVTTASLSPPYPKQHSDCSTTHVPYPHLSQASVHSIDPHRPTLNAPVPPSTRPLLHPPSMRLICDFYALFHIRACLTTYAHQRQRLHPRPPPRHCMPDPMSTPISRLLRTHPRP
ncbi:hypothetical protein K439DRAFT_489679 [Ramaria rubella]|nr:hypothetical protein K439DRAFT_489679 [Ramaria rubella]